ncbi:MAG: class II aldolase/adducin family protein [Methylococcales bacterium]|nr:class II aldolase/adducin family protein [Methylococcales bacterium]
MSEREGVIKYRLRHRDCEFDPALDIRELNAWRNLLYRLGLIGCIPAKYDGLGYGNISRRLVPGGAEFLISGTQTGQLAELDRRHYALIHSALPQQNTIDSSGLTPPSSEALTHAGVYRQNPGILAVIHVHSPELWRNTLRLQIPHIAADIAYGTPEMAQAVGELFLSGRLERSGLFSMLGHEDGIVAFGSSLEEAACLLIAMLARAVAMEQG